MICSRKLQIFHSANKWRKLSSHVRLPEKRWALSGGHPSLLLFSTTLHILPYRGRSGPGTANKCDSRAGSAQTARKAFLVGNPFFHLNIRWTIARLACNLPERGYTFAATPFSLREGVMPRTERDREIRRRRARRVKMLSLKTKLAESKDAKTRAAVIQKILKINPQAEVPQR
jgi:hypothetical protein